jgi:hypothetical protein
MLMIFKGCTTSNKTTLWKSKIKNVEGGWKLKPVFCFMEKTTHKLLYYSQINDIQHSTRSQAYLEVLF